MALALALASGYSMHACTFRSSAAKPANVYHYSGFCLLQVAGVSLSVSSVRCLSYCQVRLARIERTSIGLVAAFAVITFDSEDDGRAVEHEGSGLFFFFSGHGFDFGM